MKACGRVCGACLGVVPITATVLSQTRTITQLYLTAGEAGERGCVRAPKDEECTDFADLSAVGHKSLLESRLHIHICGFHSLCFVREGSFVSFTKQRIEIRGVPPRSCGYLLVECKLQHGSVSFLGLVLSSHLTTRLVTTSSLATVEVLG